MMKNRKKKAAVWLLAGMLACLLCAAPVLGMENGEAGITPDPPDTIVTQPDPQDPVVSQPDPGPSGEPEGPGSSVSSAPAEPNEPENPDVSHPVSSSGSQSTVSDPETPSGSQTNSEYSPPNTTSSRVVYSNPDPRESYVEYIPPSNQTGNQNNYTTSAQTPVAIAPVESNTDLLSSQNWEELLSVPSQPDGASSPVSALAPIDGIFSNKENAYEASTMLVIGIIMLVLGAGGIAFFVYSQFIYKRRKAKQPFDEEERYDDPDGYSDGYTQTQARKGDTEPLPYVPTERDISSFSNPQMKPPNPLKQPPQPPSPPKRGRVEVEDIDWDQFFKDNK